MPLQVGQIIAHRGASFDAPENTVAALRLGYAQGADAGELDIHLSQDGRIVVIHDADTARVSGHKQPVAVQTLAELRTRNAGQWGQWQGSGFAEKIPELAEILALVPAGKRLFIETKVGVEILPELGRVIRAFQVERLDLGEEPPAPRLCCLPLPKQARLRPCIGAKSCLAPMSRPISSPARAPCGLTS